MATGFLIQYMVPCITEDINVLTGYRTTVPTACPNNNTHTINVTGITQIDLLDPNQITIDQSGSVNIFNYYRFDQYNFGITGVTGPQTFNITYNYNVVAYSTIVFPTTDNIGDQLDITVLPDYPCGVLTSSLVTGATALQINSVNLLNPGFFIEVYQTGTKYSLGEIASINTSTNTIDFTIPASQSFPTGTIVMISIPRVKGFIYNSTNNSIWGLARKGSAGLPAGQKVRIIYTNNSGTAKTFSIGSEIGF